MSISTKQIPPRERLIVALDVPTHDDVHRLVETLGDSVAFYKLGLELLFADGEYWKLVDELVGQGNKVFADIKLFDVPATVRRAVRQISKSSATFATVHGNQEIMQAAVDEKNDHLKILAVTVLTSLDEGDLADLGFQCSPEELVLSRAKRALAIGCDGVISSGLEARKLRDSLGERFLIVAPGIRPVANREQDDQKRTVDVEEAFGNGADYIVMGRPILNADDPRAAAEAVQRRIQRLFGH